MTEATLPQTVPASESPPEPDPRRWIALAVIAIAQLMVVLDATIVNIALPRAQEALSISDADRQWVVTAYTLAFGGLLLLGGRIADFAGRRRTFIIGLLGFAAASAIGGAAVNSGMLFGARVVQGAFAALLAPASLSLLAVTFTSVKERSTAFAVYGAIAGGGSAVGLLLGGVLTEYTSWRWCLLVNIPIAIIAVIGALAVVRESRAPGDTRYDIPGAVLVTLGLASLVYGFTQAADQTIGWTSVRSLGFILAGLVLLTAFVVVESRTRHALLPLRILLDRDRGGSYLTSMLVGAGLFAMFLFLSYYFQLVLHYSPIRSGLAFLPFSVALVLTAGFVSRVLPRTGPKPLMAVGALAAAAGLLSLLRIDLDTSWATTVLPAEVVMGVGLGLLFVPLSSTALVGIGSHDAGVASATLNATQQIGGSLGTALLNTFAASAVTGYLADRAGSASQPLVQLQAQVYSFHVAFAWGAGLLGLGFVAVMVLIRAGRHTDAVPDAGVAAV
jgi:EmrB/QacA subfamily drug resistance transporter